MSQNQSIKHYQISFFFLVSLIGLKNKIEPITNPPLINYFVKLKFVLLLILY